MSKVAARALLAAVAGVCALVPADRSEATRKPDPVPPTTSEGRLATREGDRVVDVPLEHTEVTIAASGHLADVTVEQTFRNPYDKKIEAVYLFPLPTGAAVNDLEIEIGDRIIKGEIQKREEAKATYVKAKKAGLVAALLTQERPNLFTQHVANLEPGARVIVRMRYLEPLKYERGGYELVFPMVAGPRHIPKASAQAADADAVQPAVLPPATRSSHDIGLSVAIDAGVAVRAVSSPSHQIVHTPGATPTLATVALAAGDTIPNKDFVLRYDVAGDAPAVAVHAHRAGDSGPGAFFLTVQPPAGAAPAQVAPRELVFVIDTSSSMRGRPLEKARELVRQMLTTLAPDDTFQIVRFADAASALGDRPIANKPKNVEYALAWLDGLAAQGGTTMTSGIAAALDLPHDPARLRLVVFVTDGYVGNEDEILASVQAKLGASRLYSFGVGTAVNRYLLEEMASFGKGAVQVVRPDEDTAAAVARLADRLARPVLTDVTIDWGGLAVADVTPAAVPDLFVGQPLVISGHYTAPGTATVTVTGTAGGRPVTFAVPVALPAAADRPAIATVWARARIGELSRAEIRGATDATRAEITAIALAHRLMSKYTAFVAVDRSRTTAGGDAQRVAVPVEVPDGLRSTGSSGGGLGGMGMVGYGASGSGVGYGTIGVGSYAVSHQASAPMLKMSGAYDMRMEDAAAAVPAPDLAPAPTPAPVEPTKPDVRGRIDAPAYKAQIGKHAASLRALFNQQLKTTTGIEGRYVLKIWIDATGSVSKVEITGKPAGAAAAAFAEKLASAARKWSFDPPDTMTIVSYPIVFSEHK